MKTIFEYFMLPGSLLLSFAWGGWGWWFERKLSARFQYRIGPPWYQNFIDILKLFCKEQIVPSQGNRVLFILSPLVHVASIILVTLIVNQACFAGAGFTGDLLAILYLLAIPSLFIIIGAFASANPLATVGGAREIKLMLSYEFLLVACLVIAVVKSGYAISLERIISYQQASSSHIWSVSGGIGIILGFFYLLAKLGIVPFDVSEAEQEIMGGSLIEYSGPLLGFYKLARALLYFTIPMIIIGLFWGGAGGIHFFYKYILVILLVAVVKNTNPRLRIRDIMRLCWFFLFPLGCLGIMFAVIGY